LLNIQQKFQLDDSFIEQYKEREPDWGPLGYVTYKRTYAREIQNENRTEEWYETLRRVVEGCYTIQWNHCLTYHLPWNPLKAQRSAQEMFDLMFEFKFLPPGRGLWMMGTDYIYMRGSAALNNCAFVSTEDFDKVGFSEPFCFAMDMSLLGVGVAFDTKGAGKIAIQRPIELKGSMTIADSKEGWVEAVKTLLDAYAGDGGLPESFDFSAIRPAGAPIKTFGGIAPGPGPLKQALEDIESILCDRIDTSIRSVDIVDIMNMIGKCVVSGGVRRSAGLALGSPDDEAYLSLKDPEKHGDELQHHRWASNNSVMAEVGMDYERVVGMLSKNGEPGLFWLENAQKYGRTVDEADWRDEKARGTNPCGEQTLESYEMCNVVESFPARHESIDEYRRTLKFAYLYAKTVTLIPTHYERTNALMLRNRRIGLSQSGIVQAVNRLGLREYLTWCDKGYNYIQQLDKMYSDWLCIPRSIKTTTVKPSGTVSMLPGANFGIHYPYAEYYYRTVRFSKHSPLLKPLRKAGYRIEKSKAKDSTHVVYFPIKEDAYFSRSREDVSMWEQLALVSQVQRWWSDNQVSVTITFRPEEKKDIARAISMFEADLKSLSFLPLEDHLFEQAPFQAISQNEYEKCIAKLKPIDWSMLNTHEVEEKFCDGDTCAI